MDEGWTWGVLFSVAILISGSMIGVAPTKTENAPKTGWWIVALSPLPLVAWDVVWVVMANPPDNVRRAISLVIGALAGAICLLGITELIAYRATAQSPVSGAATASQQASPPAVTITGGDNVVSVGQISGITARTVTVNNPPMKPELRITGREQAKEPDGTYKVTIQTEVVSPIAPGLLVIQLRANGIKNVSLERPPTGGVSMMTKRNVMWNDKYYTAEIPSPRGKYTITVVTERRSDVKLEASF